eukprot:4261316-Amphidinium_carterae.2
MLSLSAVQTNKTEPPTVFEGNSKGDLSAGTTTTFKHWSTEVVTYLCLEKPRLQEKLDSMKTRVTTVVHETHIDDRLSENRLHYRKGSRRAQRKHTVLLFGMQRKTESSRILFNHNNEEMHKKIQYQITDQSRISQR